MSGRPSCLSCGTPLAEGAKFCRACGAAVDATEAGGSPPRSAEPGAEPCPSCGAPAAPDAVFCRACGERLPGASPDHRPLPPPPAAPTAGRLDLPPPTPPRPEPPRGGGPGRVIAAVLACLALGAAVAGGAYLLIREDSSSDEAVALPVVPAGDLLDDTGTDPSTEPPPEPQPEPADEQAPTTEPEEPTQLSELTPGRYVQAGSFRTPDGAQEEVERLVGEGVAAYAIAAAEANELLPGFHVLLVGPLSGSREERLAIRELEQAQVSGLGRSLTPSASLAGPEAAAGTWEGSFEQSHLRGSRGPSTYGIEIEIAADGESGTVEYPGRDCQGSLTLIEDSEYSLAYAESIESGPCPAGGVWHLRPEGTELTAVRLHEDLQIFVHGTVPQT